jgi:DNA polymerase elongation subunit (family B)
MFFSPYRKRWFIGGVSALDYLTLYQKYNYKELDNYRLDTVARIELGRGKVEYTGNLDELFKNDIEKFIEYNLEDVRLIVDMDKKLQFIELVRGICHAGHIAYDDFIFAGRIMEGALLCFLRQRGLVASNKMKKEDSDAKIEAMRESGGIDEGAKDEKFIGAYVKDPIVGKHDWIYDLDLTSLYPSIIMTINISPETKVAKIADWDVQKYMKRVVDYYQMGDDKISRDNLEKYIKEADLTISSNGVLYRKDKIGCIPEILDIWFNERVEFRKLEKKYGLEGDKEKYAFYGKRQLVQKILLNSLYGVLGLPAFRFYDVDNAEAVTTTGQTVIKNSANMGNIKYNKELGTTDVDSNIYIDTDSVFFSAVPLLDFRHPNWKEMPDSEVAVLVDGIAGEMQDYLNKFYDILSDKFFNVQKHRLEIKKEYVARAGIWIAKKRYAQWIISNNGVAVDRLDVKGLDVRRSSFPKAFQDCMGTVLIDILKGKTEEELTAFVLEFKKSMVSRPIHEIAKNSAVKNLSKYSPKKRQIFQMEKGAPAHVKAAILYNDCLTHFKAPFKYSPMKDGDKIKWVYLKNNPLGIDGLGFTGYDDPQEIVDFITTYTDHNRIFEAELKGKLQDFYNALGWGEVMSEQKNAEKFFSF